MNIFKTLCLILALLIATPAFAGGVRSITPGVGLTNTPGVSGTAVTSKGTLYPQSFVQPFTGGTTISPSVAFGLAVFAPVNGTDTGTFALPTAGGAGFEQGTSYEFLNTSSGNLTISTTTSVFKGVPLTGGNIVLGQNSDVLCRSDPAANWTCNINSVSAGGSVSVTAANAGIVVTPSPGTGTFTVGTTVVINNQGTATTYAIAPTDNPRIVEFTGGSSAVAVTLANANTTGFTAGFATSVQNFDTANVTITPTTSTINGAATLVLYPGEEADIASDGTNYIADVKKIPVQFLSWQPGLLSAATTGKAGFFKSGKALTVDNIEASALSFTCSVNPTITMFECGTSTTCASSPVSIGTVTLTAVNTVVDGTVSAGAITKGDYVAWALTAGTCTALDISATAQTHQN